MIIYNHKKEFVGIEERDLRALKLSSLAELTNEAADFADLFVKTPGYIHNFKHVHWLDFISSADSIDENRVIISVKGKNYKATLDMQKLFLVDDPQKSGYGVVLNGIRELTKEENEKISGDLAQRVVAKPSYDEPFEKESAIEEESSLRPMVEDEYEPEPKQEVEPKPLTIDDDLFEAPSSQSDEPIKEEISHETKELDIPLEISLDEEPVAKEEIYVDEDDKFKDYHYDPELASKELGLPVDLVEEFIGDFIAQAHEFKPELYEALDAGRMDVVRMTSHKLKGVAANLRIEDAYDTLVTINTSDDISEVKHNLDKFYNVIIKKLAGQEVVSTPVESKSKVAQQEEQTQTTNNPEQSDDELKIELDLDDEVSNEEPKEQTQVENEEEKLEISLDDEDEKIELALDIDDEVEKLELEKDENDEDDEDEKLEISLDLDETLEEKENSTTNEEESIELVLDDESMESAQNNEQKQSLESVSIDKNQASKEMGIDVATYEQLLHDYLEDVKVTLDELRQNFQNGNSEQAKKLALRLKGMSENMHIDALAKDFETILTDESADVMQLLEIIKEKVDSIDRMV